jgi:uncharacterized membrane protein
MKLITSGGPRWPARFAYAAAGLFSAASGITNLLSGIAKGTDFGTSLVWGTVSVGVSIVFALSWPALIRSIDHRQWTRATTVGMALLVTGAYSVSAALGSAMGGRTSAAIEAKDNSDKRAKVQAAYDNAKAELDALTTAKPASELQTLLDNAKGDLSKLPATRTVAEIEALMRNTSQRGCHGEAALNGQVKAGCPKYSVELARAWERKNLTSRITELTSDIGRADQRRADQREKAQATMDRAATELAHTGPAKVANSDAVTIAAYLQGLGLDIDADRVNKLLVLLAVLVIECGGGLALAVGMALGQGQTERAEGTQGTQQVTQGTLGVPSSVPLPQQLPQPSAFPSVPQRFTETVEAAFLRMLRERGGQIMAGQRTLGRTLGVSATHINRVLAKLSEAGVISLDATRRGSAIRLVVAGSA